MRKRGKRSSTTDRRRPAFRLFALVLALAIVVAGCGDGDEEPAGDPCDDSGVMVDLGTPQRLAGRFAEFTTTGGTVWVTPSAFEEAGPFFLGDSTVTIVEVGSTGTPPVYDEQSGATSGVVASVIVEEGEWGSLVVEAGRYWLWSSRGASITVQQCDGGLSDLAPVAP